ncbi:MAG: CBS domain-containing protein [Rhodospirillaceae bacterium]|nr:CBS domain-containing protein [Rhodospirillaceae bacterium]
MGNSGKNERKRLMQRKIIPDIVQPRDLTTTTVDQTAEQAAKDMAAANVAAIIVLDTDDKLIGIVTERDLSRRIVAENKVPSDTKVGDIMTANPDTLAPGDRASDALELMLTRRYRHLPVQDDNGKCIAMVSIRDLYEAVKESLEENIRETEAFVFGDRYSA